MITTSVRLERRRVSTAYSNIAINEGLTWSTGFMATPRVLGQELRLTANLCLARDASANPISVCSGRSLSSIVQCTQQRLVGSSSSGNDSNHASCTAFYDLLRTTWKLDSRLALVRVVANDRNVIARSPSQNTTIAHLLFAVGNHGTFGHRP